MNKSKLDREQIYHLWQEGYSIDYITREVGSRSKGHIKNLIQLKFGPVEEQRIDSGKIFALKKAGWSAARIAEEMHLPEAEVVKILIGEVKP